ncbi:MULTISPECIES: hypothetical protein [Chitinophagaceae]
MKKLTSIIGFAVCIPLLLWMVACRKDTSADASLTGEQLVAREWLQNNGGMFSSGLLGIRDANGHFVVGGLRWDSVKEYTYEGRAYMDIPFVFNGQGRIVDGSDSLGLRSYTLVLRKDASGSYEGALRTTVYSSKVLDWETGRQSSHMTQSYRLLDGSSSSFWYRMDNDNLALGKRLTEGEVSALHAAKSLNIAPGTDSRGGDRGAALMMASSGGNGGTPTCVTVSTTVTVPYVVETDGPEVIVGTYTYTETYNVCYDASTGGTGDGTGSSGSGSNPHPTGSGGSNGDWPPDTDDDKDKKNPCDQAKDLAKNASFKSKMNSLKGKIGESKEYAYSYTFNDIGKMSATEQIGQNGADEVEYELSEPIDGVIHSHYTGLLSVFSAEDLYGMAGLYVSSYMKDPSTFTFGVVTASGTQYLLKIDDMGKFDQYARKS